MASCWKERERRCRNCARRAAIFSYGPPEVLNTCRKVAALHRLTDFFEGFTAKPDIVIDDMPSTCTGAFIYDVRQDSWPKLAERIIEKHID